VQPQQVPAEQASMAPKKERTEKENVSLGPATREGENVFGVCHIFASFNDSEWRPESAFDCAVVSSR